MKAVLTRIAKLEDRLGTAAGKQQLLFVVCHAGMQQKLAQDKIEILRASGFLPTGPVGLVSFLGVPGRLTAKETEEYVTEHAAEICDPRRSLVKVDRDANGQ